MEREVVAVGCVFVGGGPASLAGAIHLARLVDAHNERIARGETQGEPIDKEGIVVLEKGPDFGTHSLSGGVMDPRGIRELFPDWREQGFPVEADVGTDEVLFLTAHSQIKFPFTPPALQNHGNAIISLNKAVAWLAKKAEEAGVTLAPGMPVAEVLVEDDRVVGVRGTDTGRDHDGKPRGNFQPGTDFRAAVTVLGEGTRGHCTRWLINHFKLDAGKHPQLWGTGVKEIWKVNPAKHRPGKVVHTMGFPLKGSEYGGSWMYHMADSLVSVGFVTGLEYEDPLTDPHRNLQIFKTHPLVRDVLEGGEIVRYGAKTVPVGGYHAIGQLSVDGCMLVGDAAGLVNGMRLKGIHMAIKSGMLAAETAFAAMITADASRKRLAAYDRAVTESWIGQEIYSVRDFHQGFERGLLGGLINAGFVTLMGGGSPMAAGLGTRPGHGRMKTLAEAHPANTATNGFKPDGKLTFTKLDDMIHSGTTHEENQPCHLVIAEKDRLDICNTRCKEEFGNPCQHFCPAAVYEMVPGASGKTELKINASNCLHCKTCDIMDPYQVITWVAPEGGGGPIYTGM